MHYTDLILTWLSPEPLRIPHVLDSLMFQLQTFGSVDLRNATGQSVQSVLAQPRRMALLLYLAAVVPQRFHRRDTLLALLWPESDEAQGRAALSQAIYFLRRSLCDSVVISRGKEDVSVDGAYLECDVLRFEEALQADRKEEALAFYQGDFLEGFHVAGAPEFEHWAEAQRAGFKAQALSAAIGLSKEKQTAGDLTQSLHWARAARAIAPVEEGPLRQVLLLLGAVDRRSEAVREYEAFADRMRLDFDMQPSAETQALVQEIRSSDAPTPARASASEQATPSAESEIGPKAQQEPFSAAATAALHVPVPHEHKGSSHRSRRLQHRVRWMAAGAGAVVLLAAALSVSPNVERSLLEENRVLVASFENRTGDASLNMLGDMAADWITQGLQETEMVQVIDPTSALVASRAVASDSAHLKDMERLVALAERSGAGVVVMGAFYGQGDSLHFRAQMISARDRSVLRTIEPVTAPSGDPIRGVERLRTRVAGTFASMLDQRVASLSTTQGRAPSFEAYREYILGLEPFQRQRYREALPHFETAARLDTTFMLPRFWAAFAHGNLGERARRDSVIQKVAVRRDRLSPLDQHSLDYFLASSRGDGAAALEATRKAARLSPGSNWSFLAGRIALEQNRPREALHYLQQIDPEHGWARGWKGYWQAITEAHHVLGQHEAELVAARRAVRLDPGSLAHRAYETRALLALARVEEAKTHLENALALPAELVPPIELWNVIAAELQAHGHSVQAREMFGRAVEWGRSPDAEAWIRAQPTTDDQQRTTQFIADRVGQALYASGRLDEARAHFKAAKANHPKGGYDYDLYLGLIAARQGDRVEAERVIQLLEQREMAVRRMSGAIKPRWNPSMHPARIAALLGDHERAMAYLRAWMMQDQGRMNAIAIHTYDEFEVLRSYAPFQALIRPKG